MSASNYNKVGCMTVIMLLRLTTQKKLINCKTQNQNSQLERLENSQGDLGEKKNALK